MIVLDASSLLAFLFEEPGCDRVEEVLDDSCMSTVNLSEVVGRFVRDGHDPADVLENLQRLPVAYLTFNQVDAMIAATLIPVVREYGLSFADRVCLALGVAQEAPVLTADRVWANLQDHVDVELIR